MDLCIPPTLAAVPNTGEIGRSLPLDAAETEALVFNLQAASNIHKRHQFFNWTQGLLQSLISHELLLCVTAPGENTLARIESFSTQPATADFARELSEQAPQHLHKLADSWRTNDGEMMQYAPDHPLLAGSVLAREMKRLNAPIMFLEGIAGPDGKLACLYMFICQTARMRPRQGYLAELIMPTLHAAWMRTRIETSNASNGVATAERNHLTRREQEVLKWIYLGKSNIEIGMILGISPLTVKNHVQEILRRLNVLNRAQAVGKAISLHLISTS
jgi:transcriptional regulator EpsA